MQYLTKRFLDSVYQKLINERRDIDSQLHRHKEKAVGIGKSLLFSQSLQTIESQTFQPYFMVYNLWSLRNFLHNFSRFWIVQP